MHRIPIFVCLLALLLTSSSAGPAFAQSAAADRLFASGLEAFRSGDYALAAIAFGAASEAPGKNPLATASGIMAAKSEYRAGNFDVAVARAAYLLDHFPASAYGADARYLLALSEYRRGNYDIAAASAAAVVREHPATPFGARGADLFGLIVSTRLPLSELRRLEGSDLPPDLRSKAALSLARAYLRTGEDSLASGVLDRLQARPGTESAVPDIEALRDEINTGGTIQVAALLPIGPAGVPEGLGRLGGEILDGVRFATEEFNATAAASKRVDIVVQDVGVDTAGVEAAIARFAAAGRVRAVVGPVFSAPFAAASSKANDLHVPIISPTATGDRLAAVGPFVFQANPDNETRGRAAASYAVGRLHMSSFAVMASDDPVGRSHAAAFTDEARTRGATVYSTVFFPPDASDLRREFLQVRRAVMADGALVGRAELARPGVEEFLRACGADTLPAFRDTLNDLLSVTSLFGARGYAVAESLGLPIAVEDTTAEQIDIPMVTADGIYLALSDPEQLDYIAPQLDYFNIKAQVIGNNEWYDPRRLRENRGSLDGVIFFSDFDDESGDPALATFSRTFAARNGKPPTKFTLYGYDTMRMILEQVAAGARSRLDLAARLSTVEDFPGLHSPISLMDGRVNRYLHAMQFMGGEVRRIGTATGGGASGR